MPIEIIISGGMALVGVISMLIALYVANHNKHRGEINDATKTCTEIAKLTTLIEGLSKELKENISEIKISNRTTDEKITKLIERVAINEQSIKTMWKRVDTLEGKCS